MPVESLRISEAQISPRRFGTDVHVVPVRLSVMQLALVRVALP